MVEIFRTDPTHAAEARGIVIVIDVIRAFSVAGYAFAGGARGIWLVRTADEAMALRERDMTALLKVPAWVMWAIGRFSSVEGTDDRWKPNDGLVNTISATAPFDEASETVSDPAALTPDALKPATWYVMPTVRGDHGTIIGLGRSMEQTLPLYLEQMRRIDELSRKATGGKNYKGS